MSFWHLTLIDFLKQMEIMKMKMPGSIYFKVCSCLLFKEMYSQDKPLFISLTNRKFQVIIFIAFNFWGSCTLEG